jgi:hypothetical protein
LCRLPPIRVSGAYLRTAPHLMAVYRDKTGKVWGDSTRLLAVWRGGHDASARDGFSPAQVEQWLKERAATDADHPVTARDHDLFADQGKRVLIQEPGIRVRGRMLAPGTSARNYLRGTTAW